MAANQKNNPSAQPPVGIQFSVNAQYVKDLSFENPNAPQIFVPTQTPPDMQMGVNIQTRGVAENTHEVLLLLKLEAKLDGKIAFIAELSYGGVFVIAGLPEDQLKLFLLVECPRLLFPFARQVLSNTVREGGYPHVMINPIDFMALYMANKNSLGVAPVAGVA